MKKTITTVLKSAVALTLCTLMLTYAIPKWSLVLPISAAPAVTESEKQAVKKMEEELAILKENRSLARENYSDAIDAYKNAQFDYNKAHDAKLALDNEITLLASEIDSTSALLNIYNEQLVYYTDAIAEKETEIDERYGLFLDRVRVNYEESFTSYLEIVLSSESFSDLLYRVDIVASLLDYDKRVLASLDAAKKDLTAMQTEYASLQFKAQESLAALTEKMPLLEKKREESAILLADLDDKMAEALKSKETAEEIKKTIESSYVEKAAELEKAEAEIAEKIRIAQEEAARKAREEAERKRREEEERKKREEEEKKKNEPDNQVTTSKPPVETATPEAPVVTGTLGWPTESSYKKISSYYGWRTSPITGRAELHNGIDIPCAYGSAIYAADGGTVLISEYHYSYGNYIVIDHGDGLSTLYAHNTKNLVRVGDTVKKGQQIAQAGSTGDSRGNHCHFCVRINGQHTDPMKYVSNK